MNLPLLFTLGTLLTSPAEVPQRPIYRPIPVMFRTEGEAPIVRAQTPTFDQGYGAPNQFDPAIQPYSAPPAAQPYGQPAPYGQQPAPYGQDPFLQYPGSALPNYVDPSAGQYGVNGPQPYRYGWTPKAEFGYIPDSTAKGPGAGRLSVVEVDAELRKVKPLSNGLVFTHAPQFGMRLFDGPDAQDLPGSVYRFGWDFGLETAPVGGWSLRGNFNPSLNTDFNGGISSDALNFDGSLSAQYQAAPDLMFVLGVMYWDRVDDIILPMGGVVWLPTDRLELRLMFPKARASYFLGNFWQGSHWLYLSGEYHVDAFEIEVAGPPSGEQVQLSDYRIMLGLRSDHPGYEKFLEAGFVLGREVEYKNGTPGFDLSDSFMARFGIKF